MIFAIQILKVCTLLLAMAMFLGAGLVHVVPVAANKREILEKLSEDWAAPFLAFAFLVVLTQFFIGLLFRAVDVGLETSSRLVHDLEHQVAERRRVEESLLESEGRYRLMAENTSEILFECDETGRLQFVSPSVYKALEWHPSELTGQIIPKELFSESAYEGVMKDLECLVHGRVSLNARDVEMRRKDGTAVWCEIRAFVTQDAANARARIHGVVRDVSWRKELEERWLQSQKLEAIGLLAGGISHDFNNLLTAIIGSAELLEANPEASARDKKAIRTILECSYRGATLTRQLLDFARLGKSQHVTVDMHEVVGQVEQILSHAIDRRITLRINLGAARSCVTGDPDQLKNAVLNLCVNARDAMPDGGVLSMDTLNFIPDRNFYERFPRMPQGECLLLRITDTGHGIGREVADRIFDPFFTTKPFGQGTGLGLSSVMGCVESHHGCIDVQSEPGKGTAFFMCLPVYESSSPRLPIETVAPVQNSMDGQGHVILMVDDERPVLDSICALLERKGYVVRAFAHPHLALEYFKEHVREPELVLLDMNMPDMTGLDLYREMKKLRSGLPALVFTGYAEKEHKDAVLHEGILGVVEKPVQGQRLLHAIASSLEGRYVPDFGDGMSL